MPNTLGMHVIPLQGRYAVGVIHGGENQDPYLEVFALFADENLAVVYQRHLVRSKTLSVVYDLLHQRITSAQVDVETPELVQ